MIDDEKKDYTDNSKKKRELVSKDSKSNNGNKDRLRYSLMKYYKNIFLISTLSSKFHIQSC